MKKLYILAALLMATTSAHAGGITLQINGERILCRSAAQLQRALLHQDHGARLLPARSAISISRAWAPRASDDDVADTTPAQPAPAPCARSRRLAPAPAALRRSAQPHLLPP